MSSAILDTVCSLPRPKSKSAVSNRPCPTRVSIFHGFPRHCFSFSPSRSLSFGSFRSNVRMSGNDGDLALWDRVSPAPHRSRTKPTAFASIQCSSGGISTNFDPILPTECLIRHNFVTWKVQEGK